MTEETQCGAGERPDGCAPSTNRRFGDTTRAEGFARVRTTTGRCHEADNQRVRADLLIVAAGTWVAASSAGLTPVIAVLLLPADIILSFAPTCWSVARHGVECSSCGLTRGFIAISRAEFTQAVELNRASIALFGACAINGIAALTFTTDWLRRVRRSAVPTGGNHATA